MTPLEAGLAAMDSLYFATHDLPNKPTIRARIRGMLRAYDKVWAEDNKKYIVRGAERLLMGPLKNLENMKDSGYIQSGKLDLILEERAGRRRLVISDHKWLSSGFDDDDIEHLLVSGQQNTYAYLGFVNGIKFEAAMWDILVKSQHVPKKESILKGSPSRIAGRKSTVNGVEYKKGDVIPAVPDTVTPGETIGEFEERVYQIYCENPAKYFARPEVPVIKDNIASHMHEAYMWTKELDIDSKSDTHLRNPDACMTYNRACSYMGLCSRRSHEEDGSWTTKEKVHEELDLPAGVDPHRVVTNSRLGCFRLCRLKHHRRYNLGLIKIKPAAEESLFVGSAGHVGLEWYWKMIMTNQGVN